MQTASAILVAEGFEPLRRLMREALERAGHAVLDAGTAREAENLDASDAASLLICDSSLPGGALALALALKQRRPDLPVLFLSMYDCLSGAYSSGLLRHASHLRKPFTIAQLTQSVAALLQNERAAQAAP